MSRPAAEERPSDLIPWTSYKHKGVVLFGFCTELDEINKLKVRDDDVWICTFPRSGTTLTQEIVYLIQTLDFDKARSELLEDRSPFIDVVDPDLQRHMRGVKYVEEVASPRAIKSHLHHFMLPEELRNGKGKIVYVARNPNACAMSNYNLNKFLYGDASPFESLKHYMDLFLKDEAFNCPWWLHVLQYWERRNDNNVLFLTYEALVQDKKNHILKIADFLGKELTKEDEAKIYDFTEVGSMRGNTSVNYSWYETAYNTNTQHHGGFINQGSVDAWRAVVPDDIQRRMSKMVQERLGHTDIRL